MAKTATKPRAIIKRQCFNSLILFLAFTLTASFALAQEGVKPEAGKQVEMSFKTSEGADVANLVHSPKGYDAANTRLDSFTSGWQQSR